MSGGSVDAVRARFIEALARRAAAHEGDVRRLLDEKLARLRERRDAGAQVDGGAGADEAPRQVAAEAPPGRSALAELVARMERPDSSSAAGHATQGPALSGTRASPVDAQTLAYFRRTWSRLSADQRLAQSRSALPENAGPLNSHHLVHRSLTLMRELSPQYLERFTSYLDALLWLDQANEAGARPLADAARQDGEKKTGRARPGS